MPIKILRRACKYFFRGKRVVIVSAKSTGKMRFDSYKRLHAFLSKHTKQVFFIEYLLED